MKGLGGVLRRHKQKLKNANAGAGETTQQNFSNFDLNVLLQSFVIHGIPFLIVAVS